MVWVQNSGNGPAAASGAAGRKGFGGRVLVAEDETPQCASVLLGSALFLPTHWPDKATGKSAGIDEAAFQTPLPKHLLGWCHGGGQTAEMAPSIAHSLIFVCRQNSRRSQMAHGLLAARKPHGLAVFSAGLDGAGGLAPEAVAVMAEQGIDLSARSFECPGGLRTRGVHCGDRALRLPPGAAACMAAASMRRRLGHS